MFLSVIAAYMIAAAFAFCGVVNAVGCIMEAQQGMGALSFFAELSVALWPLGVAAALVMLVQIACKIERWMLLWTMAQAPSPVKAATPKATPSSATSTPSAASATSAVSTVSAAAPRTFSAHLAAVPSVQAEPVMPAEPAVQPEPSAAPTVVLPSRRGRGEGAPLMAEEAPYKAGEAPYKAGETLCKAGEVQPSPKPTQAAQPTQAVQEKKGELHFFKLD